MTAGISLGLHLMLAASFQLPGEALGAIGSELGALDRASFACVVEPHRQVCKALDAISHLGLPMGQMTLEYRDELLDCITIVFEEARFETVARQLTKELGPAEARTERLRAGMGGVIENRVLVWHQGTRRVMLEQYSAKVTQSALRYASGSALEALMRERAARTRRGMRDL